jgi:Putative bacterial sensory transduction regulator
VKLEALNAHVERLLKRATGIDELSSDDKGEWLGFPYGRVVVHVRVVDHEQPRAFIYGVIVTGIETKPELYEYLNEINSQIRYCRAYVQQGTVYFEIELLGEALDYDEFDNAMTSIADAGNHFGPLIVERFGGELPVAPPEQTTTKPDAVESHDRLTGPYL